MYIIVTTNRALAEEAKRRGANIFEDVQMNEPVNQLATKEFTEGEEKVVKLMTMLAIKPNLKGYDYIKYIMARCMENPKYHNNSMTKVIYPECAKEFDTTPSKVERALRHALEKSFRNVPGRYFQIFEMEFDEQPTNSEFISMMSEYLRRPEVCIQ